MIILILITLLFALFIINTPIAIAIGIASLAVFLIHGDISPLLLIQRLYAGVDSFPLMAVPLFMYAGFIMEAGGISKRIIDLAEALVGWLPGGLTAVAIVAAMFFAGISGSAAADAAAVGSVMIPAMIKRGYSPTLSGAVIASSGSLGVIIPPSIPMIIFGFLTGASISKLFAAGILPGLLIGFSFIITAMIVSRKEGYRERTPFLLPRFFKAFWTAKWALMTPIIILGGILGGIFTATEAASVATIYGLFVGLFVHKEIELRDLPSLFIKGSITASTVLFIIATASIFSWILSIEDIPGLIANKLFSITTNPFMIMVIINITLLIAGTFVETTAALILFVPIIIKILPVIGIDIIQLGMVVVLNLAMGMLTPPLGICLIVACSIAQIRMEVIVKAVIPFLFVMLLNMLLVSYWSPVTMAIPNMLK